MIFNKNNAGGIRYVYTRQMRRKKGESVLIEEILEFNKQFVKEQRYEKYITSKYPDKKIAILSCMDTRLVELLPAAMGLKNGDVKIIKNAGGVISHPFGSVVRSLLIAIFELGIEEIVVVGHTDCGVQSTNSAAMIERMKSRGISEDHLEMIRYCGVDFESWLGGFDDVYHSVNETVELLKKHPLIPDDVKVYGFVMDSVTGELNPVQDR